MSVGDGAPDAAGTRPTWRNQLEPDAPIRAFLAAPPQDFAALRLGDGTPAFAARFDLLTTADAPLRRRVAALPLYRWWGRWLRPRTLFVGTTVSEYALLSRGGSPAALVDELVERHARDYPFVIIKDLPQQSPLLDADDNAQALALAESARARGFVLLEGQALAWVPIDFADAGDYLARLSPGRRKDIRRKLRARDGLQIEALPTGAAFADAALRAQFHALYLNVYRQSEIHFDLLTPAFFDALLQDADSGGIMFVYRHAGRLIGWNLCFVVGDALIDKYVGFDYPAAREHNLYFVSWMHNLEYARAHGLRRYVAGWTDPEIKAYLGARFTFTRHAVRPRSRVLRALLARIAGRFESDRAWFDAQGAAEPPP